MPDGCPRGRPAPQCPEAGIDNGTVGGTDGGSEPPECSARGCREPALWLLLWNNPKIHQPDRRKQWAACAAHRDSLGDFLGARGFLREVSPLPATGTDGSRDQK